MKIVGGGTELGPETIIMVIISGIPPTPLRRGPPPPPLRRGVAQNGIGIGGGRVILEMTDKSSEIRWNVQKINKKRKNHEIRKILKYHRQNNTEYYLRIINFKGYWVFPQRFFAKSCVWNSPSYRPRNAIVFIFIYVSKTFRYVSKIKIIKKCVPPDPPPLRTMEFQWFLGYFLEKSDFQFLQPL